MGWCGGDNDDDPAMIQAAKKRSYNGASTTEDNRYSMQAYCVRRVDGWTPDSTYTLEEAKKRLVDLMVDNPKEQWEIAPCGWGERVCWKHSMSNPDYVLCRDAERASAQENHPVEGYEKRQREDFNRRAHKDDERLVIYIKHFDATPFMAKK